MIFEAKKERKGTYKIEKPVAPKKGKGKVIVLSESEEESSGCPGASPLCTGQLHRTASWALEGHSQGVVHDKVCMSSIAYDHRLVHK